MMYTQRDMQVIVRGYADQIAYLKAVCRIAADRLRDGGTFPVNGETWNLLDYAAGDSKPSPLPAAGDRK